MKETLTFTAEVDIGSAAEEALTRWQRTWRRRGVHCRSSKYLHQGASRRFEFVGPANALEELQLMGVTARAELPAGEAGSGSFGRSLADEGGSKAAKRPRGD